MRHIRHTSTWCPRTDRTVWTLGGRGHWRGIGPTLWARTLDSALSLTGPGEGRRGGSRAVTLGGEHTLVDGTW